MVRKAFEQPLQGSTLRLVYKWFYFIYILTYVLSIIGTVLMIAASIYISNIYNVNPPAIWMNYGLILLYYGLYFGFLEQDIAEICIPKMAANLRYHMPQELPTRSLDINICGVCDKLLLNVGEEGIIESTFQLTCGHIFHEFCIQGWCIVGKKQTCPYCKDKFDLKRIFSNPWKKPLILYGQLLNWLNGFVAWGAIIMSIIKCLNYIVELKINFY